MRRRGFLSLGALGALTGCCDMGFPLAPWHMWGTTENGSIEGGPPITLFRSQQLARVNYGRPETFTFLLWFQMLSLTSDSLVDVNVDFILNVGSGRSLVTMDPFKRFVIPGPVAADVNLNHPFRVATQVEVAALNVADTAPNVIEWLVAQDIQAQARVESGPGGIGVGNVLSFEVGAFFAPRTHVRPEWFGEEGEQFRGKEQGGT